MKKIKTNKKIIISLVIILILLAVLVVLFFLNKNKDNNKLLKEENYTAYVKINPLVKLDFKSFYYKCQDKKGQTYDCGERKNEITTTKLMNDDAKNIYKELNLDNKNLEETIFLLIKTASENNIDITNLKITTNYNYESEKLKQTIKDQVKNELNIETTITYNYQKEIEEQEIMASELKSYKVAFDSDGGNIIESQTIKEKEQAQKPTTPTKDGYKFIEWQLDGQSYDFQKSVTKDITLKAKWEKIVETQPSNPETPKNNNDQNNNKQPETPTKPACQEKKFSQKYSYVYETEALCQKNGDNAFMNVTDNIDPEVFTYGCEKIVDDCGKIWYGVYFNKYTEEKGNFVVHY